MFTIIYPMFERGRILKKELTLALRDYSFGLSRLQYADLTDGVISGLDLSVDEKRIRIEPGLLKFHKFIYVLTEPQFVPYEATAQYSVLKVRFSTTAATTADYVKYSGVAVLDSNLELQENELELCRFKLQRGARLRNDYTDLTDIQTEYDTINLADATCAGLKRPGISPVILQTFAREALLAGLENPWDIAFCSSCLTMQPPQRDVMEAYVAARLADQNWQLSNRQIYESLKQILVLIRHGGSAGPKPRRSRPQLSVE